MGKLLRGFVLSSLIVLFILAFFVPGVYCLSVSASGSNGDVTTALTTVYGATINDELNQNIRLDPTTGTGQNDLTGTGNLPSAVRSISDKKGDFSQVDRSVQGNSKTRWSYNWKSMDNGNGVTYMEWFSAGNLLKGDSDASSISGSGQARNAEGDNTQTSIKVTTGTLKNWYTENFAGTGNVYSTGRADSATGTTLNINGQGYNAEGDNAITSLTINKGSINNYYSDNWASKSLAESALEPLAGYTCTIKADTSASATGQAYNREGDNSKTSFSVTGGSISNLYTDRFIDTQASRTTAMSVGKLGAASGTSVGITSQGLDKALGYEYQHSYKLNPKTGIYDIEQPTKNIPWNYGEGDFAANNVRFNTVMVTTTSTLNDIGITTAGFGTKTALILDPRRYEFSQENPTKVDSKGNVVGTFSPYGPDIKDPLTNSLMKAGYAVTYYSDAAVSKEKVGQMDDYWVSVIHTHMDSTQMYLSKSSDNPTTFDKVSASALKGWYTKNNGMTLLVGCNSFTNTGSGTLADAVSKASVSGGFHSTVGVGWGSDFLINYIKYMAPTYSSSASAANALALSKDPYDGKLRNFDLRGVNNKNFKL